MTLQMRSSKLKLLCLAAFAAGVCACGAGSSEQVASSEEDLAAKVAGQYPAAGTCQYYNWGGTSGVHMYYCCNLAGCPPATTYDCASGGNYCQKKADGTTTGGGTASGPPIAVTCAVASKCAAYCWTKCSNVPGLCWTFTNCFGPCLNKGGPPAPGAAKCDGSTDPLNECSAPFSTCDVNGTCGCTCGDETSGGGMAVTSCTPSYATCGTPSGSTGMGAAICATTSTTAD